MSTAITDNAEVLEMFEKWMIDVNYGKNTISKYRPMFRSFISFLDEHKISIKSASRAIIEAFLKNKKNVRESTKDNYIWLLNDFYENHPIVEVNPAYELYAKRKKARGKKQKLAPVPLSPGNQAKLINYCLSLPNTYQGTITKTIVLLLLCTGLRREELCTLKRMQVHLEGDSPYLTVMGKFSKERSTPIITADVPDIIDILQDYLDVQEKWMRKVLDPEYALLDATYLQVQHQTYPLFIQKRNTGKGYTPNGIYVLVNEVMSRAGIVQPRLSPHILRHTFGTNAILRGVAPNILQHWLGHESLETTGNYTSHAAVLMNSYQ